MGTKEVVFELTARSKEALKDSSLYSASQKRQALQVMAQGLMDHQVEILAANALDMEAAQNNQMSVAMQDRLKLNPERIEEMQKSIETIAALPNPIGRVLSGWQLDNGLCIEKITVPLGVIGIIYESRPNVTIEAATLCFQAGNAVVLKGGKEAIYSNRTLVCVMQEALRQTGLNPDVIQLIEDTSREATEALMQSTGHVDVLVPRGGQGLIQAVVKNATVPVIQTGAGNCHIYVDRDADLKKALDILENAKVQRPSVCNAVETLLVHRDVAATFLPIVKERIGDKVELRLCPVSLNSIDGIAATDEDFATEYDDYILAVKVVGSLEEAIKHIAKYSTGHSDAIISDDYEAIEKFLNEVDSAVVYANASTRFTDGGQFGFGGELGISTQKLHARGPMGLEQLTSTKYKVRGNGQIRKS